MAVMLAITAGGRVSGVNVTAGAMTLQSVVAIALSAVVTIPDTVAAGGSVPFDLVLTDPSEFFSSRPYCASFNAGTATWATDGGGSPTYLCTSTTPSPQTVRFTGSALAPSTAGTMFSQMAVWNWIDGPEGYVAFYFYAPSRQLGQPLRTSTVAAVTAVSVAPATASIVLGAMQQLTAAILGTGGVVLGSSPNWTSSNTAVATVTPTGLVTAMGYGAAVVTANAGGFSASSTVTVAAWERTC